MDACFEVFWAPNAGKGRAKAPSRKEKCKSNILVSAPPETFAP